jgi:hypothetical protein
MWLVKPFVKSGIWKSLLWKFLSFVENSRLIPLPEPKKGCFATSLATQFLSCIGHLHLTVFICCECYQTSCKSCKSCNSLYIRCNSLQFNYNFVTTIPFQVLCNSPMTTIIMLCWCHFSSIHQNLTHGTMKIFRDF